MRRTRLDICVVITGKASRHIHETSGFLLVLLALGDLVHLFLIHVRLAAGICNLHFRFIIGIIARASLLQQRSVGVIIRSIADGGVILTVIFIEGVFLFAVGISRGVCCIFIS